MALFLIGNCPGTGMFFLSDKLNELDLAEATREEPVHVEEAPNPLRKNEREAAATNEDADKVFFFSNDVAWELLLRRANRFPGVDT